MATIGQAARFAGLTARAIRHYHAEGLLPEPPRDRSGYRQYTARDISVLIRIRTLAAAGVPLSRVKALMDADEAEFGQALAEIDVQLRRRIRELRGHRAAIRALASGDGLVLPPAVVSLLDQLRTLGVSEVLLDIERDSWIVVSAQYPAQVQQWAQEKLSLMHSPEFQWMYRTFDEVRDLDPDDPRIEQVFQEYLQHISDPGRTPDDPGQPDPGVRTDPVLGEVLAALTTSGSPAWARLFELAEHRLGDRATWAAPALPTDA